MTAAQKYLIAIPEAASAQDVFAKDGGLEPFIAAIRKETAGRVFDMSTNKGRTECASLAYSVTRSKTALDEVGKEVVAKLKALPAAIDKNRKAMRDELDALAAEIRRPLTEYEEAERARVAKIEADLASLRDTNTEGMSAIEVADMLTALEAKVIDQSWGEYEAEAHRAKAGSLAILREKLAIQQQRERDQAELEELRRLKAEADALRPAPVAEVAEVAEVASEPEPIRVTNLTAGTAVEFDDSADLAVLAIVTSAEPSAPAAVPARPAMITGSTNVPEALSVLSRAKEALMTGAGLSEEQARAVVNLIRQGKVPAVTISLGA